MAKKKIVAIVGARPQFIKHFPVERALSTDFDLSTIHTGQHYDNNMSAVFFDQLGMKKPDHMLQIGSAMHGVQTGRMMIELEPLVLELNPDFLLLYGDTNSTLAGALVASKLHVPIIHVEAGLRSFNLNMPEEINRILTDQISKFLFAPSQLAVDNLLKEGIDSSRIFRIGDVMKDLVHIAMEDSLIPKCPIDGEFYYATIHRPYNTDEKDRLTQLLQSLASLGKKLVFSLHPRTRKMISKFGLKLEDYPNIKFVQPQAYFENLSLIATCQALITDSGGMQKEAYWLQKKCVTIRSETEWQETLKTGWNELVFANLNEITESLKRLPGSWNKELYGNGRAAEEINEVIYAQEK